MDGISLRETFQQFFPKDTIDGPARQVGLHNYVIRRPDGTTAAERFSEHLRRTCSTGS